MKPQAVAMVFLLLVLLTAGAGPKGQDPAGVQQPTDLLDVLSSELTYSMEKLISPEGLRPYFAAYTVTDTQSATLAAELGALTVDRGNRQRWLDVDVRVGDYGLDNTHLIRGQRGSYSAGAHGGQISLENDPAAIRHRIWLETDDAFKDAVKRYARVQTNIKVKVEEEDQSDDFSREPPQTWSEPTGNLLTDSEAWADRLRKISAVAREHPLVYDSGVSLGSTVENRFLVNSEGTRLQTTTERWRLRLSASTKAEDGMELSQSHIFDAAGQDGLPDDSALGDAFREVIKQVLALREAPLVEPYTGPAILRNRAAGVFFHEIFGHRIEGHRQKDVDEGQTFTKKLGEPILPDFLNVHDDPTQARFGDVDLRGYYRYDDEGVPAQDVTLVDHGVLKTFLMSRSPAAGFDRSNGHGRRQPGYAVVSRQGNLVVSAEKQVPFERLRELLIAECQKQDKPYGLLFEDISGGFTGTQRRGAQSFKVLPILVYRVYADGRPDELVRGVDIVGTPLSCFEKIVEVGDDPAVFNGSCGAESGWLPVSAIAPSLLVSSIEIEKRERAQSRPPILEAPVALQPDPKASAGR